MKMYDLSRFRTQIMGAATIGVILCHAVLWDDELSFSYERRPVEASEENDYQENLYHGNLLMKNTLDKQVKKNIQHTLAFMAGLAIRR